MSAIDINLQNRRDEFPVYVRHAGIEAFRVDKNKYGHKVLILNLRLQTQCGSWTPPIIKGVECVSAQRSIDYELNPTDFYFNLVGEVAPGAGIGGFETPDIRFDWSVTYPDSDFTKRYTVQYLNFAAGMLAGFNRWHLYRLDYTDPKNPSLDYVKTYAYVQGQVVEV